MRNAKAMEDALSVKGIQRSGPGAVYLVALDGDSAQCFTEPALDGWWENLSPERKAEIFDRDLEGDELQLKLHDGMLRSGIAEVVDRIDAFAQRFERAYRDAGGLAGTDQPRRVPVKSLAMRTTADMKVEPLDLGGRDHLAATGAGVRQIFNRDVVAVLAGHSASVQPDAVDAEEAI